ncbi:MAG: hypothetical protein U9P14_11905 [Gemmatimonadota bacterium]|nr:hypothetical protein [Gemmatimonadota bacterium]
MQVLAQTGTRGKVIGQNASALSQAMDAQATVMQCEDIFSNNDVVTIGEEDVTVTAHGTNNTVTRGTNSTTPAAHSEGMYARAASGAELLSYTFSGSEAFSAIRCGAEAEAWFGIEVAGTLKYTAASSPHQLEVFFPMARYQPANGTSVRVLVWLAAASEAVCWAEFQA